MMQIKTNKDWGRILLCISIPLWLYAFWVGIHCLTPSFEDLRNRVTGARLLKDGIDPYLFIWRTGDSLRYYDTFLPISMPYSLASATPAFHWLMGPLAELPQYQINVAWFAVEWACIAVCVLLAMRLARDPFHKGAISLATALFCLTSGVRQHFFQGQLYLFVPALMMVAVWLVQRHKNLWSIIVGGFCLAVVVFTRPTFMLLVAPFFLYKHARPMLLACVVVCISYGIFAVSNPVQQTAWKNYFKGMHYFGATANFLNDKVLFEYKEMPHKNVEGLQLEFAEHDKAFNMAYENHNESSNYYLIHKRLAGHLPSAGILAFFQLLCLGAGAFILFWSKKTNPAFGLLQALCWVTVVMWGFDFFTFVEKRLYNIVLLFYPMLLLFCMDKKIKKASIALLLIGILMDIWYVPLITMPATIGQILMLAAITLQISPWPLSRKKTIQ